MTRDLGSHEVLTPKRFYRLSGIRLGSLSSRGHWGDWACQSPGEMSEVRSLFFLLIAALSIGCAQGAGSGRPQVAEAPANFETGDSMACVAYSSLDTTSAPTDLYSGLHDCVGSNRYLDAVGLYAIASVYSEFDSRRILKDSIRPAGRNLHLSALSTRSHSARSSFIEELNRTMGDPVRMAGICAGIRQVGYPTYHPRYMIQNGMRVSSGEGMSSGDLIDDFDPDSAWSSSLETTLHCTPP